jgi:hypothetical protein
MPPITPSDLSDSLRLAAWQRAKGELHSMLAFCFSEYDRNGATIPNGYEKMSDRVRRFIADVESNL